MRRAFTVLLLVAVLIPCSKARGFAVSLTCDVDADSVGEPTGDSQTIQSAGVGTAFNLLGAIDYNEPIWADHVLRRQSTGLILDTNESSSSGEVHSRTRADVPLGYVYEGHLTIGADDGYPESESCSAWVIVENPEPPTDPGDPGGGTGEEGGTSNPPGSGSADGSSPILVDLDRGGFVLTDLADGVVFDLDRDGVAEQLSWTSPASGDAWLVLDRNRNGLIDDGGELFGNFTDQPPSSAPNGYEALLGFDLDGDRRITAADPVYADLRLWTDRNHDGISQSSELSALAAEGVEWLDLSPVESRSRDAYGNEFRYRAAVSLRQGVARSVDVFLLTP